MAKIIEFIWKSIRRLKNRKGAWDNGIYFYLYTTYNFFHNRIRYYLEAEKENLSNYSGKSGKISAFEL